MVRPMVKKMVELCRRRVNRRSTVWPIVDDLEVDDEDEKLKVDLLCR